jgi:hypothetical protein
MASMRIRQMLSTSSTIFRASSAGSIALGKLIPSMALGDPIESPRCRSMLLGILYLAIPADGTVGVMLILSPEYHS